MRKLKSLGAGFLAFLCFAVILHFTIVAAKPDPQGIGTWVDMHKDLSAVAIRNGLTDDTIMVMGSSEFQHGKGTIYHPTKLFRSRNIRAMFVGAAYNQCLSHAITLGSVAEGLKSKKVMLILSPAWFDGAGVKPHTFTVRFSESEYISLMENKEISDDLKNKIAARAEELLKGQGGLYDNVRRYNAYYTRKGGLPLDGLFIWLKKCVLNECEQISINTMWICKGKKQYDEDVKSAEYASMDELYAKAEREWSGESSNRFHMRDSLYKKKFKRAAGNQSGSMANRTYPVSSPEYGDLELFLQVCREENIDVEVLLLPVNGWWYDEMGFGAEARSVLPDQIKSVTDKYGAKWVSFFDHGYDDGFLEDVFHPAQKGWLMINEKIMEFYQN